MKSFIKILTNPYYFDQYADGINKITGFTVTFSPEFYNT